MKRLLWLGLLFFSISWLCFIPIFLPSDWKIGVVFLLAGLVCNVFAFWKTDAFKIDVKYLVFLIPVVVFLFVIGFPYNLGGIVLLIGVIVYFIVVKMLKYEKLGWISLGISFSGIILLFQTAMLPFYFIVTSRFHRIDFLSPVVSFFGRIFGLKTSVSDGVVYVQTVTQNYPFTTTLEKLGFFLWFMIFIGILLVFFFSSKRRDFGKNFLWFLILSGIYLILRYLFLIFVFTTSASGLDIFWDPIYLFISFLPFVLLLVCFIPLKKLVFDISCFKVFTFDRKRVLAAILIFIFIFSAVGASVYQDPGSRKKGRILIDEYHSNWESTSRKMDKEWYGKPSTYNAYSFAEWLDYYYHVDKNIDYTLTDSLLENYDVLIIKCPTNSYSKEEINAIIDFVEQGGGLYLISDHTNVFGMSFYLNQISKHFDITFRYDSTHDLKTGGLSIYKSSSVVNHPIMQYTPEFHFLSSCSLKAPLTSENMIIGNSLTSSTGTYSTEHFFRQYTFRDPEVEQGLFLQATAVKHGKGRVVAFTDSTCISNFCIFMDGYPSFNLMTMEYLNRSNEYSYVNNAFVALAVISLLIILYLLWKEKKAMIIFLFILMALLSFSIATPLYSHVNHANYRLPDLHSDFTSVCFVDEYSDFVISSRTITMNVSEERVFNTFFVWTQRVDCVPSVEETLDDALKKGDTIVFINPVKSFNKKDIETIENYLKNSGNVLLIDGISNVDSTANELLNHFNLSIDVQKNKKNEPSNLSITGSTESFFVENNHTSIAVTEVVKGRLVIVVDSYFFSNKVMGEPFTTPDEKQLEMYNVEFDLFENIFV